jgi:putative DNA primase/helicase
MPNPETDRLTQTANLQQHPQGSTAHANGQVRQTDDLPVIPYNGRPLRDVVHDCLQAAKRANNPPHIFQQGTILTRVRYCDGEAILEPLNLESFKGHLERSATFCRSYSRDGEVRRIISHLPIAYVKDAFALPGWPEDVYPKLKAIAKAPFFGEDGSLVTEPGYHAASKIWYAPAEDLAVEPVMSSPTNEVVEIAKHWLMNELLGDFDFQTDADKANALAFILTPFVREITPGSLPLALVEAPAAGTGKGLLANTLAVVATGTDLQTIPQRQSDEEWRKAITAKLVEMPTYILFDNLTGTLRSAALESALTSPYWEDRFLGETRMVKMRIRTIWLATANNLQIAGDLFRRIVWIRLDAKMEHPEDRPPSDFYHPQLLQWAKDNRSHLVWAALTLIQVWVTRGMPRGTKVMGSFDSWSTTLDGILQTIGVEGFLANLNKNRVNASDEIAQLGNLVDAWWKKFGDEEVTVTKLYVLIAENDTLLPFIMEPETEHGRKVRLGRFLAKNRDRTVRGRQMLSLPPDSHSRCQRYKLVTLPSDGKAPPDNPFAQAAEVRHVEPTRPTNKDFSALLENRPAVRGELHRQEEAATDDEICEPEDADELDEEEEGDDGFQSGPIDPNELEA